MRIFIREPERRDYEVGAIRRLRSIEDAITGRRNRMTDKEKEDYPWIDERDFNIISERIFRIFHDKKWSSKYGNTNLKKLLNYFIDI